MLSLGVKAKKSLFTSTIKFSIDNPFFWIWNWCLFHEFIMAFHPFWMKTQLMLKSKGIDCEFLQMTSVVPFYTFIRCLIFRCDVLFNFFSHKSRCLSEINNGNNCIIYSISIPLYLFLYHPHLHLAIYPSFYLLSPPFLLLLLAFILAFLMT